MEKPTSAVRAGRVAAVFVAAVMTATLSFPAVAMADPTAAEKQAEAQSALVSLNSLQDKLDRASNDYYKALDEQQKAEASRDEAQARVDEANAKIVDLQGRLGSRAQSMYRSGSSSVLDLLLGATSFHEFATNWDLLTMINDKDADLVRQTKDLRAEVEEQEAKFAEQQRIATEKADEAKRIKDEAGTTVAAMQQTYDSLSAEAAELLEQERAAQEAAELAAAQEVLEQVQNEAGNDGDGDDPSPSPTPSPSPSPGPEPSYNGSTGNAIVDAAYGKIGCMYEWGAAGPGTFDCSGLVQYCYGQAGIGVGHYTGEFMGYQQVSNPQPGDICTSSTHAGIYIGGGQMIHAPDFGQSVSVGPVQGDMIFVRP